jgi:CBS domain-containing protein
MVVSREELTSADSIRREAQASTVGHQGPTAQRYQYALDRYLNAVAGESAQSDPRPSELPGALPVRTVRDVMTTAVMTAYEGARFKDIAQALQDNRIATVPVIDEQHHVVGVVSTSDLLARVAAGARTAPRGHRLAARAEQRRKHAALTAGDLMTTPVVTTEPTRRIAEAALAAARARVRSLPVVDAEGVLVGIVTREDLIKQFLRSDADIRHDVVNFVLHGDDKAPESGITVTVDAGVVTLAGEVATALRARRIVYETSLVAGVLAVEDELTYAVDDSSLLSSGGPIFGPLNHFPQGGSR